MYRVLIVEDDPAEKEVLEAHLARYGRERGEGFQMFWMQTALDLMASDAFYDLVFMDIDLPGISGMEAAELLRAHDEVTPIIFVTNLAQYAIKGYEVEALDFVVKPVSYYGFALRMDKALRVMRRKGGEALTISTREGARVVPLARIAYVDVRDHELAYHLDDGEVISARGSLVQVERGLAEASFTRISGYCLVNISAIRSVNRDEITLVTGEVVTCSRRRRREALREIAEWWSDMR